MSLRLYMNHHVRRAITEGLRHRGVDVVTAYEDGAASFDDEHILERAGQLGRVVFTHDDDFLAIADRWQQAGRPFSGLIYAHQLRVTVGQAIEDLELVVKTSDADDMANKVQYLPF